MDGAELEIVVGEIHALEARIANLEGLVVDLRKAEEAWMEGQADQLDRIESALVAVLRGRPRMRRSENGSGGPRIPDPRLSR